MSSLRRLAVITAHETRLILRDPSPVMVLVLFPVLAIAFLKPVLGPALAAGHHPGANGAEQAVPGQTVESAFFLVSMMTFAFFAEHTWRTWDRLRASRATSLEIVAGKSLPRVVVGAAQFALVFSVALWAFGFTIRGDPLALVPLVAAYTACLVVLGVAVTALCSTVNQANAFGWTGMVLFGFIGGAFVPFDLVPAWARALAPVTPTYWAMRGMNAVVLNGQGVGGVMTSVGVLALMTAVFAGAALWRLRFDQNKTGWA